MRIDGFILKIKVIFILQVLKIASLPYYLHCVLFSLVCDDHVFTREPVMIYVIEFFNEQLKDKNVFFLIYFLILCKYLKFLRREIYFETLYERVVYMYIYLYMFIYIFILIFHVDYGY